MKNMVLLVIDVQNALVEDQPYRCEEVIQNIKSLIDTARSNDVEVLYVCHDDGKGSELEKGTYGWQVYDLIAPVQGEKIIDKNFNSAFHRTKLRDYLEEKKIKSLMIIGMQTEYCVDTTIKSAFDYEYKMYIPEGANTTFDNDRLSGEVIHRFYNQDIWDKRFADVISMDEALKIIKNK
ncbi:cysteine hydrolase family protein [Inconstantimicrobium porci]|uniref:Cysteine hydrolase n=1 Tax=Inconstantimicrobium porci TaxID=2652291 RepID=A0A7X2MYQ9_9CLOT|nr:cysteine hydrolase family protein [Inconstantimicrobium porci]MSR91508.1 cysteine hydrolase [Inconstantimicrobium porci]